MVQHITEITLTIIAAAGIALSLLLNMAPEDTAKEAVFHPPTSGITVDGTYCSQGGFLPASINPCEFAE